MPRTPIHLGPKEKIIIGKGKFPKPPFKKRETKQEYIVRMFQESYIQDHKDLKLVLERLAKETGLSVNEVFQIVRKTVPRK